MTKTEKLIQHIEELKRQGIPWEHEPTPAHLCSNDDDDDDDEDEEESDQDTPEDDDFEN